MEQQNTQLPFEDALNYMDAWQSGRLDVSLVKQQEIIDAAGVHGIAVEFFHNDGDDFYFTIPSDINGELNDDAMRNMSADKAAAGSASTVGSIGSAASFGTAVGSTLSSASTAGSLGSLGSVAIDVSEEKFDKVLTENAADVVDFINIRAETRYRG